MVSVSNVLLLAAMAAIAISFILIFSPYLPHNPQERLPNNVEELTPESGFASGYFPHYLNASFPEKTYEVKRGDTISLPITVVHKSHVWWQWVFLYDFRVDANYYMQLDNEVAGIDAHFTPTTLVVWSNSSAQSMVTISVPESLPEEAIGKMVQIRVIFFEDFPYFPYGNVNWAGRMADTNLHIVA